MSKPRVAFIAPFNPERSIGVMRKVNAQVKAFTNAGFSCDLLMITAREVKFITYARQCLPFCSDCMPWDLVDPSKYDALYIRRTFCASRQFIRFLKRVRAYSPTMPIVYEIPTYPYDQEMGSPDQIPLLLKDRAHRNKMAGLIDYIADLSGTPKIFGIPTLQIFNGVDLESVAMREPKGSTDDVRIAFAGTFFPWHGIDRMIRGLATYYAQNNGPQVSLHLMGEGSELKGIRQLAEDLGVEQHCVFYGTCDQDKMDEVYNECTFSFASLGLYRIGIYSSSTLKSREYLAKGMPFAYAGDIDVFEEEPVDFCLQVPNDDTDIDVSGIVEFHKRLYANETQMQVTKRLRSYAERHVSMDVGMKNVIDYYRGTLNE